MGGLRRALTIGCVLLSFSCTVLSGVGSLDVDDTPGAGGPGGEDGSRRTSSGGSSPESSSGAPDLEGGSSGTDADVVDGDASAQADALVDAGDSCNVPGLTARWRLDEGGGTLLSDCTPNALKGTLVDGNWTTGRQGQGIYFGGSGYANFENPMPLRIFGALTACAWIRLAALPQGTDGRSFVISKTMLSLNDGWRLAVRVDGQASMAMSNGSGTLVDAHGGQISPGTWTHLCGVFSPNTRLEVYVDGVAVDKLTSAPPAITPSAARVLIGRDDNGYNPISGTVDDVRIYARALDASEIASLRQ